MPFNAWIALSAVVVVAVGVWLARRALRAGSVSGLDINRLRAFVDSTHGMIGEHLRANWNGDQAKLPAQLSVLLDRLEATAREQGLPLDREELSGHLARAVASQGFATLRQVEQALKSAGGGERAGSRA